MFYKVIYTPKTSNKRRRMMSHIGYYLPEADITRSVYIKEEPQLEPLGHFHEGIEIVAVLEGEVEAFHINRSERLKVGEIFFADSFDCHHYSQISQQIRAIVIVLSSEYTTIFQNLYHGKTLPPFMKNIEKNEEIIQLMKTWLSEADKDFILNVGYSNLLFSKFVKNYDLEPNDASKDKNISVKLLKYINEHYTEDISLTTISKMLGYTKEYCSKIFSEVVGMSFRDYLNFLRLKKAKEYLALKKSTKQTTTEIIYKCGFNSTATFYRALKGLRSKNINI